MLMIKSGLLDVCIDGCCMLDCLSAHEPTHLPGPCTADSCDSPGASCRSRGSCAAVCVRCRRVAR